MAISRFSILKGIGWTAAGYACAQAIRLAANIALARLLAPELFGVMSIVNSVRTGLELVTDVALGQNIIQNPHAEDPKFYNTAWTLQLARGIGLFAVCAILAVPVSRIYDYPGLFLIIASAGLAFAFIGASSMARFLVQKRMQFRTSNVFEVLVEAASGIAHVLMALLSPTIWALVIGGIASAAMRAAGSYLLLPTLHHRLFISREYVRQILSFGVWIGLASTVYFLATSFDRLYMGKVVPFSILGVYSIARSYSELLGGLVLRVAGIVVFPMISSAAAADRRWLREHLWSVRLGLLLVAAIGLSVFASVADLVIAMLYDQRYWDAGWMASLLVLGVWFSVIAAVNEAVLTGFGKPVYGAVANALKFGCLLLALPAGFLKFGIPGAVVVVACVDAVRYVPILVGQIRLHFSFFWQDGLATIVLLSSVGFCEWARWLAGFGTSLDHMVIGR